MVQNRALTYIGPNTPAQITTTELDLENCYKQNEIVIRIHAAAFNPVDFAFQALSNRLIAGSKPKTYSKDYAGTIVKTGSDVKDWSIGDKVCGLYYAYYDTQGAMRDYLIIDPSGPKAKLLTKLPEFKDEKYNDFVLGCAWPLTFSTALEGFTDYGKTFTPESKVLVLGASTSVGYNVVQIAKGYFNIKTVVGTCNSKSVAYNKSVGYDYLVAYDTEDVAQKLKEFIATELDGEKFDMIYDCAGDPQLLPHIHDYLKPKSENSYYVTVCGDNQFDLINPTPFRDMFNYLKRCFSPLRSFNYHHLFIYCDQKCAKALHEMVAKGLYKPRIDSVLPLDQYETAIDKVKHHSLKGKIVITFDG